MQWCMRKCERQYDEAALVHREIWGCPQLLIAAPRFAITCRHLLRRVEAQFFVRQTSVPDAHARKQETFAT